MYIFVFADDWLFLTLGDNGPRTILRCLLTLQLFGVPLKLKKSNGGSKFPWIGYEILLSEFALGISESRAAWLKGWISKVLESGSVVLGDLMDCLGRMVFVYGALSYDLPFLAPLYAFGNSKASTSTNRLPVFVAVILRWLLSRLEVRRHMPCAVNEEFLGERIRVDAKAEGEDVAIGGWLPTRDSGGLIDTMKSPWFIVKISKQNAAWAFDQGEAYKTIASLELLATLVSLMVLKVFPASPPRRQLREASFVFPGWRDSRTAR